MIEDTTNPRAARFAANQSQPQTASAPANWQAMDKPAQILHGDPAITDLDTKADIWDLYHAAKDETELAQNLQQMPIPDDTKQRLVAAKFASKSKLDRAVDAITRLRTIPSELLGLAESHPTVFKSLVDEAMRDSEKVPQVRTIPVPVATAPVPAIPAPANASHEVHHTGRVIGHVVANKFVPLNGVAR